MKADVKKEFDRLEAIITTQGEIIKHLAKDVKEIKDAGSASKLSFTVFDKL